MYVLFLVIAALFLFAVLVSIIKYGCSQVFGAFFPCAVLGFTIKYGCSRICGVRRRVVGIFSYSSPEDYLWITQGLESPMFRGSVEKTLSLIISNNINSRSKYREAVEKCDFAILYHTKNRGRINLTNVTDSLYDEEIKHMSLCKGRKNVIVVVDDLEKSGYEEKYCILDTQPDISKYAQDLILVSSKDKKNQQGINNKLQQILDLMSDESMKPIQYCDYLVFGAFFPCAVLGFTIKYVCSRICGVRRRVVGIFSYSSPEDYLWITQGLESPMFRGSVEKTIPSVISNNINSRSKYREAVEKCDFAILYHTKNRGRINLTNVTDSLYDEEIKHMSLCKGRMNVIVVVDDLEKSGYEEKCCILDTQPDISKYARDLILVSNEDKRHQQGINNKLQLIGDLMSDESMNPIQYFVYLSSMVHWVCNTVMCCPPRGSSRGGYRGSSGGGLDAPLLV
ncbi:uncharacterized protein [Aquarana catesbeiana]|uniref:uncharacterized protein isoform X2 n=1 Tax=Aquarana catesbeiana TaxID=8400 RepID=UPI003CCA07D4